MGALRELKRRTFQEPAVHQVTKQRDIGFIALLMVLTSWANTCFPYTHPRMAFSPSSQPGGAAWQNWRDGKSTTSTS